MGSAAWRAGGASGQWRCKAELWMLVVAASAVVLLGLNAVYLMGANQRAAVEHTEKVLPLERKGPPNSTEGGFGRAKSDYVLLEKVAYYSDEASPGMMDALLNTEAEGMEIAQDKQGGKPVSPDANNEVFREAEDVLSKKKAASELHPEAISAKRNQLNKYVEWHRQRGLAPSLDELMSLQSTSDIRVQGRRGSGSGDPLKVTVILNVFQRKVLAEQLNSLFKQTVASHIAEVWVCAFDSPLSDYVVSTVEEAEHENVRVIVSDVNFKFYGRFQMALTAPSDFVWLLDDDVIPGAQYLEQLMHAAGTKLMGRSVLGSVGRVLPRPGRGMHLLSYREWGSHGGMFMPDYYWDQTRAVPVDFLCSQWFLRPEWLQYMWRERPATFKTGEDFHISHTLRKYAGISTYVMPCDVGDEDTKGSKFQGLSYLGAATHKSDVSARDKLWMDALKTGSRMRWMDMFTAENAHVDATALVIVRTEEDVRAISPLTTAFKESAETAGRAAAGQSGATTWKPFIFSPSIGCDRIVELLGLVYVPFCSPSSMRVFGPTGSLDVRDGWSAVRDLEKGHPAEYELAVTAILRQVLYTIKAQVVINVNAGRGGGKTVAKQTVAAAVAVAGDGSSGSGDLEQGMSSASLERAAAHATAIYNDRVEGSQTQATIISMEAAYRDMFPELNATMVAVFHEPKVIDPTP